jgi:hypothetical protein
MENVVILLINDESGKRKQKLKETETAETGKSHENLS